MIPIIYATANTTAALSSPRITAGLSSSANTVAGGSAVYVPVSSSILSTVYGFKSSLKTVVSGSFSGFTNPRITAGLSSSANTVAGGSAVYVPVSSSILSTVYGFNSSLKTVVSGSFSGFTNPRVISAQYPYGLNTITSYQFWS